MTRPGNPRAGFSLVELIIGLVLTGIAMAIASVVLFRQQKTSVETQRRVEVKSAAGAISAHLQKFIHSGDVRFFSHTGNYNSGESEAFSRALFAIPCMGRDLVMPLGVTGAGGASTWDYSAKTAAECKANTAFVYVHYDKTTTPAVSGICGYKPIAPATPDKGEIEVLVDLNNTTYGPAQFDSATNIFNIAAPPGGSLGSWPAGPIDANAGKLVAIMNPPTATLWVIKSVTSTACNCTGTPPAPAVANVSPNPLPSYDPSCVSALTSPGGATPKYGRNQADTDTTLYRVKLEPLLVNNVFQSCIAGAPGVGTTDHGNASKMIQGGFGKFPMRFFSTSFRVFGRLADNTFGLRECAVEPVDPASANKPREYKLNCAAGRDLFKVPGIKSVQITEKFNIPLAVSANVPAPTVHTRYQLQPVGVAASTATDFCTAPDCTAYPVGNLTCQRGLNAGVPEEMDALLGANSNFSQVKHDLISAIRVKLTNELDTNEVFDVYFP